MWNLFLLDNSWAISYLHFSENQVYELEDVEDSFMSSGKVFNRFFFLAQDTRAEI